MGSAAVMIAVGAGWCVTFALLDRPLLTALLALMCAYGLLLLWIVSRGRLTTAAIVTGHVLPLFIAMFCLFDNVSQGLHRTTQMHFLSVALAGYFIFRRSNIYLRYVVPAMCLAAFVVFSNTSIGFQDPALIMPASVAQIGVWINTATSMAGLIFIVVIMNADLSARRLLEVEMRKAIANGDFQLHYQPQVNDAGEVVGAEGLIRWKHARLGSIAPLDFIPLAEETGLIVPIGNWVLREACAQLALWEAQPETRHLTISVNVSASQFRQPDFVQGVSEIVRLSGITPSKLKLELTESMFVDQVDSTVAKMNALRKIGIVWSLDDFGTGYSSLSVLHRFPLGQIKIDKAFVAGMLGNRSNMVVTEAIIALASKLNLQVIAEGIETSAQLSRLREAGCLAYQGYLFSPPLDIEAFSRFLAPAPDKVMHLSPRRTEFELRDIDRVAMSRPSLL